MKRVFESSRLLCLISGRARGLVTDLYRELKLLNSAGLGDPELLRLPSADRVRYVKLSLARRHGNTARCC